MNERSHQLLTNALVLLGLNAVFSFLLVAVGLVWDTLFVINRTFEGQGGLALMYALSLVPCFAAGVAVGSLVPRSVHTSRYQLWAFGLGLLAALMDLGNFGAVRHLGRPAWQGILQGLVIVTAVLVGTWLGHRRSTVPVPSV
jgi:hypothetical protein